MQRDPAPATFVAHLPASEHEARRISDLLTETLDPATAVCAAFEIPGGGWQVEVHFVAPLDAAKLRAMIAAIAGKKHADTLVCTSLAQRDWVAASLAALPPVRAGRFIVHGAHDRARIPVNRIGIEIEAALAFGTGHHGTTRGCLLALDDLAKRRHMPRVLDIGTGSGVLAIAGAKILRARIIASDIDRVAVIAAKANARLNRVAPAITFAHTAGASTRVITTHAPYNLIFANILLWPLMRLAVPIRRLAAPSARIVLSGLLPAHANAVLAIYCAQGLMLEKRILLDGWLTLVLRRQ